MTRTLAFQGLPAKKELLVTKMETYRWRNQLVHWTFGSADEEGRFYGCALGCSLHILYGIAGSGGVQEYGDHKQYETLAGVPTVLARLHDHIFERLPDGESEEFAVNFWRAIPVGADLSSVYPEIAIWVLRHPKWGMAQYMAQHTGIINAMTHLLDRQAGRSEWQKLHALVDQIAAKAEAEDDASAVALTALCLICDAQQMKRSESRRSAAVIARALLSAENAHRSDPDKPVQEFWTALKYALLKRLAAAPVPTT